MALLKSSAQLVKAIEPAVRLYEEPPSEGMEVETPWGDVWLSADDWADAFEAPDPGTPHNEACDQIWEELGDIPLPSWTTRTSRPTSCDGPCSGTRSWSPRLGGSWPLLEATDLVGDLWSVPAYLRMCAPWLSPERSARCSGATPRPGPSPTCPSSTRRGTGSATPRPPRRKRRQEKALAAEREEMSRVVDHLIATDDSDMGVMSMLRKDMQEKLVDVAALPSADPDLLAGPFAHIVVDEAQELTDAEWQMLLLRCPSRSLTVVGDRAQARHGFAEWQERSSGSAWTPSRWPSPSTTGRRPR